MRNSIDLSINKYSKEKKLTWQAKIDDRTYLRRIYLDVVRLIPSSEEQDAFLQDSRTDKRDIWLENLLNRNDDYATHWKRTSSQMTLTI